jgi:hypothetical protein
MRLLIAIVLVACSGGPPPVASQAPAHTSAPSVPNDAPIATAPEPQPGIIQSLSGVDLLHTVQTVRHNHDGRPARLGHALLEVDIRDRNAHSIAARSVELLHAHCYSAGWDERTPLTIADHAAASADLELWDIEGTARGVTIPAGSPRRVRLIIGFKAVEVYQACDKFGFALQLSIDSTPVALETDLRVVRVTRIP